jgi:hypothetical protein
MSASNIKIEEYPKSRKIKCLMDENIYFSKGNFKRKYSIEI